MKQTVFIDTSILCNLLMVPGKDQDRQEVAEDFKALQKKTGCHFILPVTAVIETGNHIAQLSDGRQRRTLAEKFQGWLKLSSLSLPPYILHNFEWNADFINKFLEGAGSGISYIDHAQSGVGAGDVWILTEIESYRARVGKQADIRLWTLDTGLGAHCIGPDF
ncbi:hypothetical protein [Rothia sp. 32237D007AR]